MQQRPNLHDALSMFLLDNESRGFTPKTLDFYRHRMGLFLRYCDERGATTLDDLTT